MKFVLSNLPMPPSSNAQYWARGMMVEGKPVGRITPSVDLRNYVDAFAKWALKNNVLLAKAKKFVREECLLKDRMIQIDTYACFPGTSIWTRDGRMPKRLDASNRLKALHDCLAEVLQVDDSYFWAGRFEKIETRQDPWAFVVLKPFTPRGVSEIDKENL